jgi:hypothetical protein
VIRKFDPASAEFNSKTFSGGARSDLRFSLNSDSKPKYLVVYTTRKIISEGRSLPRVERDPSAVWRTPFGPGVKLMADALGVKDVQLPSMGEVPYFGAPVSGESSLSAYVLTSIDQEVPIN